MKILLGVAAVLAIMFIWNWIAGWGLVTVHVQGQPLSKIITSIEKQGGIKIVTNAPGETTISMDVDRVPAVEAVDMLAARLDGNWSVGYVAGPSKTEVTAGIASMADGGRNSDFRSFGLGGGGWGGFGGGMEGSSTPIDSRLVVWNVSASDTPQLQSYLDQLSQKTGLMAMVPNAWNPDVKSAPKGGKAGDSLRAIVKSVNGTFAEIFVIRVNNFDRTADAGRDQNAQPQRPPAADGGFAGARPQGDAGGQRDGERRGPNNEWMEERAKARLALLPSAEREQAEKDMKEFDKLRAEMEKARALPEEERRAAFDKIFNNPVVQERMAERMAQRDEKSGPDKRAQRSRDYIQRKEQMKQQTQ
jgi:hypothetical protein